MKKILLILNSLLFVSGVYAQGDRIRVPESLKRLSLPKSGPVFETCNLQTAVNPYVHSLNEFINEEEAGGTVFDLQSNASSPSNRVHLFNDGTIGAVWTRGTGPTAYADRGTGYNYFNGDDWGPFPTNRVETERSGWPAYTACGPNGEAFVSHVSGTAGLTFVKRDTKGSGAWTETVIAPPSGASGMLWPRMVCSGPDNMYLHIFALTAPVANGGTLFNNQDGALVYIRSTDAGATWSAPEVLEGMGADYYVKFSGDSYSLNAKGDHVAFLLTDNWTDLFAMKSADNGETWEKILVWEHPIPFWNNTPSIDTIYCPDGAGHSAFDTDGRLHIVFGINRSFYDTEGSWFPFVDGIAYWNESMEPFTGGDQVNILDPDNVFEMGNLVGYMVDINENGILDFVCFETTCIGNYELSPSSMPQIVIGGYNQIFIVFSSVTEGYDNEVQQYRHLWMRNSPNGGENWGSLVHLTEDIIHILDECVFPTVANNLESERLHLIYQADQEPGLAVRGDEDTPGENIIYFMTYQIPFGTEDRDKYVSETVISQNYPNPNSGISQLDISFGKASTVSLEVYNLVGQKVYEIPAATYQPGKYNLTIDGGGFKPGIYTCTVLVNGEKASRKMMVH
jgi:hypothetical protein